MNLRESFIQEIQSAPLDLLRPLYEVWKVLKAHKHPLPKHDVAPDASLIGALSDQDAQEMTGIINQEFNTIEGDW